MSKKVNRPQVILQSEETTTVVTIKRKDNEKKPVNSRHSLGGALDDLVLQQLDEESSKMYSRKWLKFQNDDKSKKKTLDDFVKTLSTKSIPTGVIPLVKTKVEQLMKDNKIENLTAKDIPTSALWMHHIIEKLKKKGQLTIDLLIENFVKMTKSKIHDDREADDSTENSNFGVVTYVTEEKESIRTVGKTLKGVINPKFDYGELLGRLDKLQHESNLASARELNRNRFVDFIFNISVNSSTRTDWPEDSLEENMEAHARALEIE